MAKPNQPVDGLNDAERAIAEAADEYRVEFLQGGRRKRQLFRSFSEARAAAAMSPDPKASIVAVSESGNKVTIARAEWPRWEAYFA